MIYDYEKEFNLAFKNTEALGFKPKVENFLSKRHFDNETKISQFIKDIQKNLLWLAHAKKEIGRPLFKPLSQSIISNCGPFHFYFKPIIERILNCKCYITVGYVKYNSKIIHYMQLEQITEAITTKHFPFNHHIWLTLDSGEILDMTLPMTYSSIVFKNDFIDSIEQGELPLEITNIHPSELPNSRRYYPIIIGEDILTAAGHNLEIKSKVYVYHSHPE